MSRWDLPSDLTLSALADKWLDDISPTIDAGTAGLYRMHLNTHLIPHFGSPHGITAAAIADYGRRRLRVVKRSTLQKERSALRGFLSWCEEQRFLLEPPEFPKLPRRAIGTAYAVPRRGKATDLSPEECRAVIAALPQWSRPRGEAEPFPVRARFIVAYETALRPATLDALSVPEHYVKGDDTIRIADEIDKARFGRVLPLTDDARRALDSVARTGIIFGRHNYRRHLSKAAKAVLPPAKARSFAAYDFRHARLTELAEGGNLTGVAYLAGHRLVTTTSIYVRPGLRAAERALAPFDGPLDRTGRYLAANEKRNDSEYGAKKRGRTSTSFRTPEPETAGQRQDTVHMLSAHELAVAVLGAAAAGSVPEQSVNTLARAALELTTIGRLALGVLDGGPYALRRAIELARAVVDGQARLERKEGGS